MLVTLLRSLHVSRLLCTILEMRTGKWWWRRSSRKIGSICNPLAAHASGICRQRQRASHRSSISINSSAPDWQNSFRIKQYRSKTSPDPSIIYVRVSTFASYLYRSDCFRSLGGDFFFNRLQMAARSSPRGVVGSLSAAIFRNTWILKATAYTQK